MEEHHRMAGGRLLVAALLFGGRFALPYLI